jgi:hypothetical protein
MNGICLMGEIPDYLSRMPFPYPRASQAVLDTLAKILGLNIAHHPLQDMIIQMEAVIDTVYQQFPPEIRERLEQRKFVTPAKQEAISEEDEQWFKEHIDEFFNNKDKGV